MTPNMPGLYIHIPFCEHKCIYCDFYSIAPNGGRTKFDGLVEQFLTALRTEITLRSQAGEYAAEFSSIFVGGGTPSLLPPSGIADILEALHSHFRVAPGAEITLETNPGTVDAEKLRSFRHAGVNRLSIGIQSFHDDELAFLSRIHSSEQARRCVGDAYRAGFDNVSMDLIFSLPSHTLERWESNLRQAVALHPTHLSCYSLIVEPNTPLATMVAAKQISPLPESVDAALYELTIQFLESEGFEQYEVSNFARPGYKSRHNLTYWNHDEYLGFGPSAHSFWNGRRFWNVANIVRYTECLRQRQVPEAGSEQLTAEELMEEEIFLGLRSEGIDLQGFRHRYGKDLVVENERTNRFIQQNLMRIDRDRLRLTAKGFLLCDEIASTLAAVSA